MCGDPEAAHEQAMIKFMLRRLDGFADGLGLHEAVARKIVKEVAADMPMRTNEERLMEARARMVAASV
jgi:hypothetical protein